jgi:hypothetical protein
VPSFIRDTAFPTAIAKGHGNAIALMSFHISEQTDTKYKINKEHGVRTLAR